MVETAMTELVGDLEHDVVKATLPDPARRRSSPRAHGVFVLQHLVLPLVEAAEDHHQTVPVARLDDAPHAGEIRLAQRPIGANAELTAPS